MESYSRDLLCRLGREKDRTSHKEDNNMMQQASASAEAGDEGLELSLSLNGSFGQKRKLERSSSIGSFPFLGMESSSELFREATIIAPLGRTSSLPVESEDERRRRKEQQSQRRMEVMRKRLERRNSAGFVTGLVGVEKSEGELKGGVVENGVGMQREGVVNVVIRSLGSRSSSDGSSDGESCRVEVGTVNLLTRTNSLPTETEEEWKKKELQSLKRLELKRKRLERRSSVTLGGEKVEEIKVPRVQDLENILDNVGGKQMGANVNHVDIMRQCGRSLSMPKPHWNGQGNSSSVPTEIGSKHLEATGIFQVPTGPADAVNTSSVQLLPEHASIAPAANPSALTAMTRAATSRMGQAPQKRFAERAKSMGDVERVLMQEMPSVSTKNLGPDGKRVEGFLYMYRRGEEVRIVCVCHGHFLTPAEFIKHAGGGDVAHPLKHIVVNPTPAFL